MCGFRNPSIAACLVLAAGFFVFGVNSGAGEKKQDKKKEEPKKKDEPKKNPEPILSKSAELTAEDEKDTKRTKSPRKVYKVTLEGGKRYKIDLASRSFDAYLRLLDAEDKEVAYNDDLDLTTFDARIVYEPAKTGAFKIVVTSFDGRTGKFSVNAIETGAKAALLTGSRFAGTPIELKLKDGKASYSGELNEKDASVFKRSFKLFTVELEKGTTYRLEVRADDPKLLDAYLFLETAAGFLLKADGGSGKLGNPSIVIQAEESGPYRVIATSIQERRLGRFTLDIAPAGESK